MHHTESMAAYHIAAAAAAWVVGAPPRGAPPLPAVRIGQCAASIWHLGFDEPPSSCRRDGTTGGEAGCDIDLAERERQVHEGIEVLRGGHCSYGAGSMPIADWIMEAPSNFWFEWHCTELMWSSESIEDTDASVWKIRGEAICYRLYSQILDVPTMSLKLAVNTMDWSLPFPEKKVKYTPHTSIFRDI